MGKFGWDLPPGVSFGDLDDNGKVELIYQAAEKWGEANGIGAEFDLDVDSVEPASGREFYVARLGDKVVAHLTVHTDTGVVTGYRQCNYSTDCKAPATVEYSGWGWLCAGHDEQNTREHAAWLAQQADAEERANEAQREREGFALAMHDAIMAGMYTPAVAEAEGAVIDAARRMLAAIPFGRTIDQMALAEALAAYDKARQEANPQAEEQPLHMTDSQVEALGAVPATNGDLRAMIQALDEPPF